MSTVCLPSILYSSSNQDLLTFTLIFEKYIGVTKSHKGGGVQLLALGLLALFKRLGFNVELAHTKEILG